MTPDESLQALRAALAVLIPRRDSLLAIMGTDYKRDELDELIDAAASLDVWLSKGGWLPAAWSQRTEANGRVMWTSSRASKEVQVTKVCLPNGPGCFDFRCNQCWEDAGEDPFPGPVVRP